MGLQREISKRHEVNLQRLNLDFTEKAKGNITEFKRLLEVAERRTSEQEARRAVEKRLYEEEIERVREEGNRRVEEVGKMADEINRQAKEEATRRAEERRVHNEEVERVKIEWNRREEEIFKRTEDTTKKAREAIAAALAGKEEAERRYANLMEEAEQMIGKAVEEATTRVEREWRIRQRTVIQNSGELPDSDADVEAVQDLVQIPTTGPSNRGMDVEQRVTLFPNFNRFF
jgi:membrane protein involved in colicin uptake